MPTVNYIEAAGDYLDSGWSVIPVNGEDHPKPKRAAGAWERYQRFHADDEKLSQWWGNGSRYRLAVVTGRVSGIKSDRGLAVLDVDSKELAKQILKDKKFLNSTYAVRTPSGGVHLYFYEKESSRNRQWPGVVDIRAEGGYVVAPPTPGYKVVSQTEIRHIRNLEAAVDTILDRYDFGFAKKERDGFELPEEVEEGGRNNALFMLASTLRGKGVAQELLLDLLRVANQRVCKPPLEDEEVITIAESASKYAPNSKRLGDKPSYEDIAREVKTIHSIALIGEHGAGQLAVYRDGVYRIGDGPIRSTVLELLGNSWTPVKVNGTLQALMDSAETPIIPQEPPIDKINLLNGVLDVRTGTLLEHSPEQLSIVQLPVFFDKKARCPVIDRFLEEVLPADLVPLFFELAGWLMVPDMKRKTAILFLGETDTGKSTAIRLLQSLLGMGNFSSIALQDLDKQFQKAELVGKLANFFDDLSNTTVRDTGIFKTLTGEGNITVERKYGQPYSVKPFARLLFAANEPPRTWDTTSAYFNRWLIFNFPNQIKKKDPFLVEKMTNPAELSGFFNKALTGLRKGAFSKSLTANDSSKAFRVELDPVLTFLEERCIVEPNRRIDKARLVSAYNRWAQEFRKPTTTSRSFNNHLATSFITTESTIRSLRSGGRDFWSGISLK